MCCVCAQSCLTPCDPIDFSPPGSSVYGILPFNKRINYPFLKSDSVLLLLGYIQGLIPGLCVLFYSRSTQNLANMCFPKSHLLGFPGGSDDKESSSKEGDRGSIPGSRRSPGEGTGYPLQYSCLENSMDRGAWQATVHGVEKSWT